MPTPKQWVSFSHALIRLLAFEPFLQSHIPTGTGLIILAEYPDFHGHRVSFVLCIPLAVRHLGNGLSGLGTGED